MFDPTAYENIKVVFEGMLYDYDLNGDIIITERNDFVNLANLSRSYNLQFVSKADKKQVVKAKIELASSYQQLASEWMPFSVEPGANLSIHFYIEDTLNEVSEKRIVKFLKQASNKDYSFESIKEIYGDQRTKYHFIFDKYESVTENMIDELALVVQEAIEICRSLFETLKR